MAYTGTLVVIPTRNRSAIAINAIRSVLDQQVENIKILVSDNSTWKAEREALSAFCSKHSDNHLRYVRPPQPMGMPPHWNWAIEQALAGYELSHFVYLTDRMMFRKGALKELMDVVALYPHKVISYNLDRICDEKTPIRLEQYPGTEKLLEVDSRHLSKLFSEAVFHPALPRMLNCIAPREVLERMQRHFGSVFASIAPDFNFCCRCLDIEESILFFDKSPVFHYALNRSIGATATRGEVNADNADFIANLPVADENRNYATPIPQLITAVNAAFNEYLIHKQQAKSTRFFDLDLQKYLWINAVEINEVRDPALRTEMLALLITHGYKENENGSLPHTSASWSRNLIVSRLKRVWKRLSQGGQTKPVWLFLARRFKLSPPGEAEFQFWTIDEAIDYSMNISRGNLKARTSVVELLQARECPRPATSHVLQQRQQTGV